MSRSKIFALASIPLVAMMLGAAASHARAYFSAPTPEIDNARDTPTTEASVTDTTTKVPTTMTRRQRILTRARARSYARSQRSHTAGKPSRDTP